MKNSVFVFFSAATSRLVSEKGMREHSTFAEWIACDAEIQRPRLDSLKPIRLL